MTKIQIIQVREFSTDHVAMKKRLRSFLQEFRARKITRELVGDDEWSSELEVIEVEFSDAEVPGSELTYKDEVAIADRVRCLVAKRNRASGTAHLKDDDRKRLSPKEACMRALMAPSEHWADEIAAALHAEMHGWDGQRKPPGMICAAPHVAAPRSRSNPCCSTVHRGSGRAHGRGPWPNASSCRWGRAMRARAVQGSISQALNVAGAVHSQGGR